MSFLKDNGKLNMENKGEAMEEQRVSGNIWAKSGDGYPNEIYWVENPHTGSCYAIRAEYVTPADLRALADRIEKKRSK